MSDTHCCRTHIISNISNPIGGIMRLNGRISHMNSSKTLVYIVVKGDTKYPYTASFEELSGPLVLQIQEVVSGTPVEFTPLESKSSVAIEVDQADESFDLNCQVFNLVEQVIRATGATLIPDKTTYIKDGKYKVYFFYRGKEIETTIAWKTRIDNVVRFIKTRK